MFASLILLSLSWNFILESWSGKTFHMTLGVAKDVCKSNLDGIGQMRKHLGYAFLK